MELNDVRTIVANLDDFLELPDGIERLRKAVLTLAVSGRLVPNGSGKWRTEKLGDVCSIKRGKKPTLLDSEAPSSVPYLEAKFIRGLMQPKFVNSSDKNAVLVKKGDLIIICDGSNSGEFFTDVEGVLASTMAIVSFDEKTVEKSYLEVFLENNFGLFNNAKKGAAIPHLDFKIFNELEFPIPTLEEQRRIVEKTKEVMSQLDELEAKKKERDAVRARLTQNAMRALGEGKDKLPIKHLSELVKTQSDLQELEMAVLTLAISGKLVRQIAKEETAESLYLQIQKERAKQKVAQNGPVLELNKVPFGIPMSWKLVGLQEVFDVRDGTHDSPKYVSEGNPLVTSKNLSSGKLDLTNVKLISGTDYTQISRRSRVNRGDLLFAMIGSIGNPVIVDVEPTFAIKNVALFKYYSPSLSEPNFLLLYLIFASRRMRELSGGGVQSFVSLGFLRKYPFPLPPLAEQKRIVKKVQEIREHIQCLQRILP